MKKEDELARRDIVKTFALGPMTIAGMLPLAGSSAAAAPFSPKFFSVDELELVTTLAELIIPQTDTPGARAARVHELIDLILSEETPAVRNPFREGLAWVDRQCRSTHGKKFLELTAPQQNGLLTAMSTPGNAGHHFFMEIRRRTVFAYYTSEIGLHQELNYQGHQVIDRWPGCPHPDHHGDVA